MNVSKSNDGLSRRRRISAVLLILIRLSDGFLLSTTTTTTIPVRRDTGGSTSLANRNQEDTWSKRSTSPVEGQVGVRRRVRAVLERAKSRAKRNGTAAPPGRAVRSLIAESVSADSLMAEIELATMNCAKNDAPERNGYHAPHEIPTPESMPSTAESSSEYEVEPLPFTLPILTDEQKQQLRAGERVQEQSKMGRDGSGFVVVDVQAPAYVVWECLLDFEAYPQYIKTVRSMSMLTNRHLTSSYLAEKPVQPGTGRETRHYGRASISRASFVLSKFRLNIAAVHRYQPHPEGHYMVFTLDKACTNMVLQDAKGIWYTQSNPDGLGEDVTRVWLFCEVKISPILPSIIVDYAAERAMPRATTWLKPTVEELKAQFTRPLA